MFNKFLDFIFNFFDPERQSKEDSSEFLRFVMSEDFKNEPCQGSLDTGDHCHGCFYEYEHTRKGKVEV